MSTAQFIECLGQFSDVERLEIIEAATRLVRKNLTASAADAAIDRDAQIRAAAAALKDLYEPGGELTEWTALDAEEFVDDYYQR